MNKAKINKTKIILTDHLINEPSHHHTKIDQSFLKEKMMQVNSNFEFVDMYSYKDIGAYLSTFIDNNKAESFDFDFHEPVDNDVAAILLPLGHGDENTLWHIAYNGEIKGFSKTIQKYCDRFLKNSDTKGEQVGEFFIRTFRIPVFESYKFLPGYRFENRPLGGRFTFEEMMPIVKTAYDVWLNNNFSRK